MSNTHTGYQRLAPGNHISLGDHHPVDRHEVFREIVREVEEAWSDIRDHGHDPRNLAPGTGAPTMMEQLEGSNRLRVRRMDDAVNRLRRLRL